MDEANVAILQALITNARVPKTELARRLKITEAAIRKRLKKLEESRIIVGYRTLIDYQKAGLMASITGIDAEPERLWEVIERLRGIEEITSITLTSGDHMIMVEIVVRNMQELQDMHKRIESLPGVTKVCPAIILKRIK